MEICSSGHNEVCYSSGKCPACEAMDLKDMNIRDMQKEDDRLTTVINNLEHDIKILKIKLRELEVNL